MVFNHIYEHVVDPDAVVPRSTGCCPPTGSLYLGLANRLGVVEPHYRLPFLSWLPHGPLADRYVRAFGRADHYYEQFRTRRGLRRLFAAFDTWDYTLPVLADPVRVRRRRRGPAGLSRGSRRGRSTLALPMVPTYIWVGFRTPHAPAGPALATGPRHL